MRWVALATQAALVIAARLGTKSADAFEQAAKMAPEGRALALRCRSAEELLTSGALDEGRARLRAVAKAVGLTLPPNAFIAAVRFLALRAVLWLRGYGTGAPVEVRVVGRDALCVLHVMDQGIGIDVEQRSTLFQRFARGTAALEFSWSEGR